MNLFAIWTIARFEAKLLNRSWAFRIFNILGVTILMFMSIALGTKVGDAPLFLRSLSESVLHSNLIMLNMYQGIIAAFLATEFIKRDQKFDTSQVVFIRSFSNIDYFFGKLLGILSVFFTLNFLVVFATFIIIRFFSTAPFAWEPFILLPLLIGLPTLVFVIGLSLLLVNLIRSQALVFVIILGYSLLVLIVIGSKHYFIYDFFAFYQPMIYSDFIDIANLKEVLQLRGAYLLTGIGLIFLTTIFFKRLKQSVAMNIAASIISVGCILGGFGLGALYLNGKMEDSAYRNELKQISSEVVFQIAPEFEQYDIKLKVEDGFLNSTVTVTGVNKTSEKFDSLLFSLNPGLTLNQIRIKNEEVNFTRNNHLIWINLSQAIYPDDSISLFFEYSGIIDERISYLDIEDERFNQDYRWWMFSSPKKFAFQSNDFLLLTQEVLWYPRSGLSPGVSFPNVSTQPFAYFTLEVTAPSNLTVISQGNHTQTINENSTTHLFTNDNPLPKISVTAGEYVCDSILVDSTTYFFCHFEGHDYYKEYFNEISDTLEILIRDLKNEFEAHVENEYPYKKLILAEVPIQFYAFNRSWTMAQETTQPQIIFLPEAGTTCSGADFKRMKRRSTRQQERANQEDSPKEIQAGYFTTFTKTEIFGTTPSNYGIRRETNIESRFHIIPNYISYQTHITSPTWPVLNYAFESYFYEKVFPPTQLPWRRWYGLSDQEKANLAFNEYSLADIIKQNPLETELNVSALRSKGRFLLSMIATQFKDNNFDEQFASLIKENKFKGIPEDTFIDFVNDIEDIDFGNIVNSWYYDTLLPGYLIEDVESYKIVSGEKTKTQVKFSISNPTEVNGMVELSFRYRQQRGIRRSWRARNSDVPDYETTIFLPANTKKEIGILLDKPPAEMKVETFVSKNIPAVFKINFKEQKLDKKAVPFDGEIVSRYDEQIKDEGVLMVDNEDAGFEIINVSRQNYIRNLLYSIFDEDESNSKYVGLRPWDPPSFWLPTTSQEFYGKFIHSGYYKRAGNGSNIVSWNAEIESSGDYDIYCYFEGASLIPNWFRRRRNNRETEKGNKYFKIHHDDGIEEFTMDLSLAEVGWNYIGTYRISEGKTKVELIDKNESGIVTADAVKWIKR